MDQVTGEDAKLLKNRSIGEVFPIIIDEDKIPVVYNFDVVQIKKKDGKFKVSGSSGGQMEFDYVFWAAPLPDFHRVAHKSVYKKKVERIVKSSAYTHAATSVIDIKDVSRGWAVNLFNQNVNAVKFTNDVVVDADLLARGQVKIKLLSNNWDAQWKKLLVVLTSKYENARS